MSFLSRFFPASHARTYLDYASATPCTRAALAVMRSIEESVGNPGALHEEGRSALAKLADARVSLAHFLQCRAREIIFTSGATEANNLVLQGIVRAHVKENGTRVHYITSSIEHSSVLEVFKELERQGVSVTYVQPDDTGRITTDVLEQALTPHTRLISIGWANSETGTLQPISALSRVIRAYEREHGSAIIFHTDAGQAPLYEYPYVHTLGADAMTLDSGKLYGPKGVGALYINNAVTLQPLTFGGGQERGLRPGTEPVALACGFAAAVQEVEAKREPEAKRTAALRSHLVQLIDAEEVLSGTLVNAHPTHHLPHILNISIPDIDSEYITLALDQAGFAVATKSSCREGEAVSHVVAALPGETWRARNTLRISFGADTSQKDIVAFARALSRSVRGFRTHR